MSRRAIVLIGAGSLGKRTLQALAQIEVAAQIVAVDPSPSARDEAARVLNDLPRSSNLHSVSLCADMR